MKDDVLKRFSCTECSGLGNFSILTREEGWDSKECKNCYGSGIDIDRMVDAVVDLENQLEVYKRTKVEVEEDPDFEP